MANFGEFPTCGGGNHNDITVNITVRNNVENVQFEERSYSLQTMFNTSLIDIMGQLQNNSDFRFEMFCLFSFLTKTQVIFSICTSLQNYTDLLSKDGKQKQLVLVQ